MARIMTGQRARGSLAGTAAQIACLPSQRPCDASACRSVTEARWLHLGHSILSRYTEWHGRPVSSNAEILAIVASAIVVSASSVKKA